jgi:hypothetical protein
VVPGKPGKDADRIQDGKDVADILKSDKLTSPVVKNVRGDRFTIALKGGTTCRIVLKAAPAVESTSKHRAGPAVYTLTY